MLIRNFVKYLDSACTILSSPNSFFQKQPNILTIIQISKLIQPNLETLNPLLEPLIMLNNKLIILHKLAKPKHPLLSIKI
jgi:hypothetical protein